MIDESHLQIKEAAQWGGFFYIFEYEKSLTISYLHPHYILYSKKERTDNKKLQD